ncbi:MAG: hypothetical protein DI535_27665 [Citrobacter freundii]|nr:MAG: hypothetical protein DI535_27665 [Citrobacter freundii]
MRYSGRTNIDRLKIAKIYLPDDSSIYLNIIVTIKSPIKEGIMFAQLRETLNALMSRTSVISIQIVNITSNTLLKVE